MNNRIEKLAKKALSGDIYPQEVSYEPENAKTSADTGRAIAKYLSLQTRELREDEYLADRYRFSGMWSVPTCYYRNVGGKWSEYWQSLCYNRPTNLFYWGWTHVALDYEYLLNNGFSAYYERIEKSKQEYSNDAKKLDYLEGMRLCLDGLCARYDAYRELATELAQKEQKEERKASLLRLADTFTRIPKNRAESFFDAVQFAWIGFSIAPDSLGRIDQYLLPYYRNDLKNGVITEEFAFELLEELFIKVHETQANNNQDISGHNHLVVGGYLKDGTDGFNELSKLILEAIVDLPTHRPQASFRYTKYTTPETMRYITEMNKKVSLSYLLTTSRE